MSENYYNKSNNKQEKQKDKNAYNRYFSKKDKKYDKINLYMNNKKYFDYDCQQDNNIYHKADNEKNIKREKNYSQPKLHNLIEKQLLNMNEKKTKYSIPKRNSNKKLKKIDDLQLFNISYYDNNNQNIKKSESSSPLNVLTSLNKEAVPVQGEGIPKYDKYPLRKDKLNSIEKNFFDKYNESDYYNYYNETDKSINKSFLAQFNTNFKEVATNQGKTIPEHIVETLFNSIVRVHIPGGKATGFFVEINVNDKKMKCLFTCFHVISDEDIKNEIFIDIYFGRINKERHRTLILRKKERFMEAFKKEDVTMIEIIDDDMITDVNYLTPDLYCQDEYKKYLKKNCYLAGY